jgi:Txe/YoeB family toxin of Txe-Axe toxin-antitoxin module
MGKMYDDLLERVDVDPFQGFEMPEDVDYASEVLEEMGQLFFPDED